jgi:hypothetical protein
MKATEFICSKCGEQNAVNTGGGSGFATDEKGGKICFKCCAVMDSEQMAKDGEIVLYLVKNEAGNYEVTNWPGTLRISAKKVYEGRHNIAGTQTHVWFTHSGREWIGVQYGRNSDVCRCKRLK